MFLQEDEHQFHLRFVRACLVKLVKIGVLSAVVDDNAKSARRLFEAERPQILRAQAWISQQANNVNDDYYLAWGYCALFGKYATVSLFSHPREIAVVLREAIRCLRKLTTLSQDKKAMRTLGHFGRTIQTFLDNEQLMDPLLEAHLLSNLATSYNDLGEYRLALPEIRRALEIYLAKRNSDGEASALNTLARSHAGLNNTQRAIELANKALAIRVASKDIDGEALTLSNLGVYYQTVRDYSRAIQCTARALQIISDNHGRQDEVALNTLACIHNARAEYDVGLQYALQALAVVGESGDSRVTATILGNVSNSYSGLGREEVAIDFSQKSLQMWRAFGDREQTASVLVNLGGSYRAVGDIDRALECGQEALRLFRDLGNHCGEGQILSNLGGCFYDLGKYHYAVEYAEAALQKFRSLGDVRRQANTLRYLGASHARLDKHDEALAMFELAIALYRTLGDAQGETQTIRTRENVFSGGVHPNRPLSNKPIANETSRLGAEPAKSTVFPLSLQEVRPLLEEHEFRDLKSALEAPHFDQERLRHVWGVCMMRQGKIEEALRLFRSQVVGRGLCLREDARPEFKLNFATAMLLDSNVEGCVEVLGELDECKDVAGAVARLRQCIQKWKQSLSWGDKLRTWFGGSVRAIQLDFRAGEIRLSDSL